MASTASLCFFTSSSADRPDRMSAVWILKLENGLRSSASSRDREFDFFLICRVFIIDKTINSKQAKLTQYFYD